MKKNHKGFTLLELLIAATIIGILAVFATISYRNSAADARVAEAKSKLDMVGWAVQRYKLDPSACLAINSQEKLTVENLAACGYLEKDVLEEDDYFLFQVCNGLDSLCPDDTYLACMSGKNNKLPNRYLSTHNYRYCADATGKPVETLGAE